MELWHSIILGIVEGLTEFLPISSTFHLIISSKLLGLEQTEFVKLFEVVIQAGAIAAVLWLYGLDLWRDRTLITKLIFSFIPTAIVGFVFHQLIKEVFFETTWLMIVAFIVVGVFFIIFERWLRGKPTFLNRELGSLTTSETMLIGLAQALAVVPGVSRAGAVIVFMMFLGVKRDQAAKYSFLLALPTIGAAALLDLLKFSSSSTISSAEYASLAVGSVVAFISALVILRWFIRYLQRNTLEWFGVYRIVAGLALAGLLLR